MERYRSFSPPKAGKKYTLQSEYPQHSLPYGVLCGMCILWGMFRPTQKNRHSVSGIAVHQERNMKEVNGLIEPGRFKKLSLTGRINGNPLIKRSCVNTHRWKQITRES